MNKWNSRSREVASLLNPAFCCVLLTTSVVSYSTIKVEGMPLSLTFIALPVLLNDKSRKKLPRNPKSSLTNWLDDNANIRLLIQNKIISLKPYIQEAILFGLFHDWLYITSSGDLKTSLKEKEIVKIMNKNFEGDTRDIIMRSRFLGKWFALSGSTETVMALWGIRP